MILCNNITNADEAFFEENYELFEYPCEECADKTEEENCEECAGEGRHDAEPYQYYLIDGHTYDLERLKEYGVEYGYSEKLDLHVLPIYDFGTGWSAFSYSKEVDDDYGLSHDETAERTTVY